MNKFIFFSSILISFFHKILTAEHNCPVDYIDCFNCTTCGETEIYYSDCLCLWNSGTQKCDSVTTKPNILSVFNAFSRCKDTSSQLIQEKYCGVTSINLDKDYTFSLPLVDGLYGTRSIYCEYKIETSSEDDIYYHIDYNFNPDFLSYKSSINLYLTVTYDDYTSASGALQTTNMNKDLFLVKEISIDLYFERGFDVLPFSFVITKKKDNSKLTLYITIGIIIFACVICALSIYCLSKKISESARIRQRALFDNAMAHQNGEDNDDEEDEQKKLEEENKLKIKFALKHTLKAKKFLKKYGTKDGNTCTICIEDFKENKSRVSVTQCKHVFHYQCLSNWLSKNVMNPKCPNCNYNLIQDVKDTDIQTLKIKPETIKVSSIKINNIEEGENNNNEINANRQAQQNNENTRNINVVPNNINTDERYLATVRNENEINQNN